MPMRAPVVAVACLWSCVVATATEAAPPTDCSPSRPGCADRELRADLLGWAARLSGLPAAAEPPPMRAYSPEALAWRVCPERPQACRNLVAVYDIGLATVLYRDTLDLREPTGRSFIVHEFVHHLQHRALGDRIGATCEDVVAAERQAYAAQDGYLRRHGGMLPVGTGLRTMHCPPRAEAPARDGTLAAEPPAAAGAR
jgi:hypothetical protein